MNEIDVAYDVIIEIWTIWSSKTIYLHRLCYMKKNETKYMTTSWSKRSIIRYFLQLKFLWQIPIWSLAIKFLSSLSPRFVFSKGAYEPSSKPYVRTLYTIESIVHCYTLHETIDVAFLCFFKYSAHNISTNTVKQPQLSEELYERFIVATFETHFRLDV